MTVISIVYHALIEYSEPFKPYILTSTKLFQKWPTCVLPANNGSKRSVFKWMRWKQAFFWHSGNCIQNFLYPPSPQKHYSPISFWHVRRHNWTPKAFCHEHRYHLCRFWERRFPCPRRTRKSCLLRFLWRGRSFKRSEQSIRSFALLCLFNSELIHPYLRILFMKRHSTTFQIRVTLAWVEKMKNTGLIWWMLSTTRSREAWSTILELCWWFYLDLSSPTLLR